MESDLLDLKVESLDSWLWDQFVCPVDHAPLTQEGNWLISTANTNRRYPVVNGIPVFLRDDIEATAWWAKESLQVAQRIANGHEPPPVSDWDGSGVHPHVQSIVDSTGGYLYRACKGHLTEYPIPRIRIANSGAGQILLDGGCNWGRWTFAAARAGIAAVGVDPSLGAILAAKQIRQQLGLNCSFFVGDIRFLPFRPATFSNVFSYSVVQHFSKADARTTIAEFLRILCPSGECLVQMPNGFGIRSMYHLAKRSFHSGKNFDVRYYSPSELERMFRDTFGNSKLSVDGFFGLGIQPDDLRFMPLRNRMIISASEILRNAAGYFPFLGNFADSLYVNSVRAPIAHPSE